MRRQLATLLRRLADRLYPNDLITMTITDNATGKVKRSMWRGGVRFDEPDANGVILKREAFEQAAKRLNEAVAERDIIKVRDLVFRRKDDDNA